MLIRTLALAGAGVGLLASLVLAPVAGAKTEVLRFGANSQFAPSSISCPEVGACFVVGDGRIGSSDSNILQLSDRRWATDPVPAGSSGVKTHVQSVACTSTTSCVAAGAFYRTPYEPDQFAEIWDGSSWRLAKPAREPGVLEKVSCVSADYCVAVGRTNDARPLAETWNGANWTKLHPAGGHGSRFYSVSCWAVGQCMTVGERAGNPWSSLVERLAAGRWRIQKTSKSVGVQPSTVVCESSTRCTATGLFLGPTERTKAVVEHWNGRRWSQTQMSGTGFELTDMACPTAGTCVAVGGGLPPQELRHGGGHTDPLVATLQAGHWTHSIPAGLNHHGDFAGVSCETATSCNLVGSVGSSVLIRSISAS